MGEKYNQKRGLYELLVRRVFLDLHLRLLVLELRIGILPEDRVLGQQRLHFCLSRELRLLSVPALLLLGELG